MTTRINTLRAALATVILAGGAVGAATATSSVSCDPMYPCFTDGGTPAAVFDPSLHAPYAADTESAPIQDRLTQRSPAAVYDLASRTDHAPCQSYPCYPESVMPTSPMAADAATDVHAADQQI